MDRFRLIEDALPQLPEPFELFHVKTRDQKARTLIYKPVVQGQPRQLDKLNTHLFVLSYDELEVFALEAFVYESKATDGAKSTTTLFISKADTTGHYYQDKTISIKEITTAIIRGLLRHYVNTTESDTVRVCLFAKAERQYLFPLSSDNAKKHILWDSALVKWWCSALEPLGSEFANLTKARLQIPGADDLNIRQCFPKNPKLPWQVGDIFWADDEAIAAVNCIPRFPDDPKRRFLEYLVAEKRAKKTTREQFWVELQARQEFRLGSVVGIIGLEGTPNRDVADPVPVPHHVSLKQFKIFRDCLVSNDFSKDEYARDAHHALDRNLQPISKLRLKGKWTPPAKPAAASGAAQPVNMLSGSMIRKKKK